MIVILKAILKAIALIKCNVITWICYYWIQKYYLCKNNKLVYLQCCTLFCSRISFAFNLFVYYTCLYNFAQSISSSMSSMFTVPMIGLKNSSAITLALMDLSKERAIFSLANLAWSPLWISLTCSFKACCASLCSPWMYCVHCNPGRSERKIGR